MLYSAYGTSDIINELDYIEEVFEIIIKIKAEKTESRNWDIYLINYPNMTKENYKTFEEWKKPPMTEAEKKAKIKEINEEVRMITMSNMQTEVRHENI